MEASAGGGGFEFRILKKYIFIQHNDMTDDALLFVLRGEGLNALMHPSCKS